MVGLALILAFLQAASNDGREDLRRDRLILLAEYADARADRMRIEKTLEDLKTSHFDAAEDETLRRLTVQLTESEKRVADLEARYGRDSKAAELVEAAGLRDALNRKVQAAQKSLPGFYEAELAEAREREEGLRGAIEELQKRIDPVSASSQQQIVGMQKQLEEMQKRLQDELKKKDEGSQQLVAQLQAQVVELTAAIGNQQRPPTPAEVRVNQGDKMDYAYVPKGVFQMGCVPADRRCKADEKPGHSVTLTQGFWMATTEVTVKAYRLFVAATGRTLPKQHTSTNPLWKVSGQPMSFVKWTDANAFCGWAGGRLPTEAEWEYAARADSDGSIFPWGNTASHDEANYQGKGGRDQYDEVADAGSFRPNKWGLYDMIGNVGEWVADYYEPSYASEPSTDPKGPKAGELRIIRGGSWSSSETGIRSSAREAWKPGDYASTVGFRCVVDKLP